MFERHDNLVVFEFGGGNGNYRCVKDFIAMLLCITSICYINCSFFSGGVKRLLRRLPPLLLPNAQSLRPFRRVTPQEVKNGQIQTPQLLRIQTNGTNDYRRLWYWISDSPLSLINLLWPGLKTSAIKAPTLWRKTIMLRCQQRAFGYQFHFGDHKLWSMHMIVIHYKQIDWIIKSTYLIRLSCWYC